MQKDILLDKLEELKELFTEGIELSKGLIKHFEEKKQELVDIHKKDYVFGSQAALDGFIKTSKEDVQYFKKALKRYVDKFYITITD